MIWGIIFLFFVAGAVAGAVLIALAIDEAKREGKPNPVRESLLNLNGEWQKLKTTIKKSFRRSK